MTLSLETIQQMPADDVRRALAERLGYVGLAERYAEGGLTGFKSGEESPVAVPDFINDANEWCKLFCAINISIYFFCSIETGQVFLRATDAFSGTMDDGHAWIFEHDNTPQSIGLAVCRATLWFLQENQDAK